MMGAFLLSLFTTFQVIVVKFRSERFYSRFNAIHVVLVRSVLKNMNEYFEDHLSSIHPKNHFSNQICFHSCDPFSRKYVKPGGLIFYSQILSLSDRFY